MKNWHVLYTKPRNEKKVTERLSAKGYEVYCPLVRTMRQWSDRKKKVAIPMFPSYVFVKVDETEREKIVVDPGVLNFIFWLGKPAIVREVEIEAIKRIAEESEEIEVTSLQFDKGDLVKIDHGPFKGMLGVVNKVNKSNVILYIEQLGCQIQFKQTKKFLEKASE